MLKSLIEWSIFKYEQNKKHVFKMLSMDIVYTCGYLKVCGLTG